MPALELIDNSPRHPDPSPYPHLELWKRCFLHDAGLSDPGRPGLSDPASLANANAAADALPDNADLSTHGRPAYDARFPVVQQPFQLAQKGDESHATDGRARTAKYRGETLQRSETQCSAWRTQRKRADEASSDDVLGRGSSAQLVAPATTWPES